MADPDRVLVRVGADPIAAEDALAFVADPAAGATCLFVGTVRDHGTEGAVRAITYEAWDELAAARLREIADELFDGWSLRRVALVHRHGDLAVGEASVAVAVSAPHRAEAFDAARHAIERLKHDVPIWKKETLTSGDGHWVQGA
ncbi:MAG TPA: molybdenum cofactor biosynthesis protein MoaE [Actinomycetota bacterium]|nr:molybdenum cofactor biosynthesis protein MoaE [Actinomycetota bacterium]